VARPERRQRRSKQAQERVRDEEVARLVAAHRAGTGIKKLAVEFGVHRDTVHNVLTREGALRRRGIHADDLPEVTRLYRDGWALARLAVKFDVSRSTVTNALRRAGVSIRRPGRPPPLQTGAPGHPTESHDLNGYLRSGTPAEPSRERAAIDVGAGGV